MPIITAPSGAPHLRIKSKILPVAPKVYAAWPTSSPTAVCWAEPDATQLISSSGPLASLFPLPEHCSLCLCTAHVCHYSGPAFSMPSREGPSVVTLCPDPASLPVLLTPPWFWRRPLPEPSVNLLPTHRPPGLPRISRPAVRLALGSGMGGAEGLTPGTREFGPEGALETLGW